MKKKSYLIKPSWERESSGRRSGTYLRNHTKIIGNPGLVIKVLSRKRTVVFFVYFILVALIMLNLANYTWPREPQQCTLQRGDSLNIHSRSNARYTVKPPQAKNKQLVYILTTWRSGSSFFGELFNQNPGVFFLYEPMWHIWRKLYPGDALSLQGAERDMLRALYKCDFSVFQLYNDQGENNMTTLQVFSAAFNKVICSYPLCSSYRKDMVGLVDDKVCKRCPPRSLEALEKECLKYDTIVIKGVRILDINALAPLIEDPSTNLKVIHLVRDPRAVASSRIRSKHGLIRENLQVVRSRNSKTRHLVMEPVHHQGGRKDAQDFHSITAMEVICQYNFQTLKMALSPPSWFKGKYKLVRYEDLVENPIQTLENVYRFVNLSASHDIKAFVTNMTSGNSSWVRPFQVSSRNATVAVSAWRNLLTFPQIRQVEEYCRKAMSILGYIHVRNMWEVRDLSRSLITFSKL
ncbi:carbohydrate sulfotransferase 2a [Trichomycterus rosablanca]|uniref:carbohydrate sulfotransferase 2a n=1 Tax=Trichomycterus rosablanca TaxID=2290929 RepID=UPI002F351609